MVFKRVGLPKPPPAILVVWDGNCEGDAQCQGLVRTGTAQQPRASLLLCPCWDGWSRVGFLLLGGHVGHEVHLSVAVAEFIVVPGNELYKVVIESNASPSIEGGGVGVTVKVTGDDLVLSVAQDAL
ncbi:hypothetical protein ACRRTK_020257 [Alexandromys fortis]